MDEILLFPKRGSRCRSRVFTVNSSCALRQKAVGIGSRRVKGENTWMTYTCFAKTQMHVQNTYTHKQIIAKYLLLKYVILSHWAAHISLSSSACLPTSQLVHLTTHYLIPSPIRRRQWICCCCNICIFTTHK